MGNRRIPRRLASIEPIWGLNALVAAGAIALYLGPIHGYPALQSPAIAWYVIAGLVLASERFPVALQFRRSSHSFSLTDIPLTLSLIFATGGDALSSRS
jgi:hypothetical protein